MEFNSKIEQSEKLNTKGCCFLCLQSENIKTEELDGNQVLQSISIRQLLRHLQILTGQSLNCGSLVGQDNKEEDIEVDLCENCGQMISRFSVLFQKLEKIQLEMDYFLERIHTCISQSAKVPELMENYSMRMTSDLEALSQLSFVDNLRNEIAKESLKKSNAPRPQLILTRVGIKLIKTENVDEVEESHGRDIPENYFSDEMSPPSSPNSTVGHHEEVKISLPSTSTSQENEKLSPLPNPPVTPNVPSSMFYTRNLSTRMYECKGCDKKSKCRGTIIHHFKYVHQKLTYKCNICSSVFSRLQNLIRHKKLCREKYAKAFEKEKNNLQSGTNGRDFPETHFQSEVLPRLCTNSTADQVEDVNFGDFSSAATSKEKLSATIAPSFEEEAESRKESQYFTKHSSTGMYECRKCDKKSISQYTITDHFKRIHLKLGYKCDICNVSAFIKLSSLTMHKKTCRKNLEKKLAEEKDPKFKFICKICEKRFEANSKLVAHRRCVHKNVNRFKCDLCDKKYTSAGGLKNHQAVIHQSIKFYCKICNKKYKCVKQLKKHERKCVEKAKIKVEPVGCSE